MESQELGSCSSCQWPLSGSWPEIFTSLRVIDPDTFTRPQVEESPAVWNKTDEAEDVEEGWEGEEEEGEDDTDGEGTQVDDKVGDEVGAPAEDSSIARVFMRNRTYLNTSLPTKTYHPGFEHVEAFCGHVTFDDLRGMPHEDSEPIAFFEEVSQEGLFRKNRGLMSLQNMHLAMQQPRLNIESSQNAGPTEPNADQRRIYIHNISPEAAAAIMARVSEYEAPAVRELFSRHLNRDVAANVQIPSFGFKTFAFHLSVPFYTMAGEHQLSDYRMLNLKPLRRTLNIAALGKLHREIYESQTSIIVTGVDEHRWTAIRLADSAQNTESVRYYGDQVLLDTTRKISADGKCVAPYDTALDPRQYFLSAWEEVIKGAATAWARIVARVEHVIKEKRDDLCSIMDDQDMDSKIQKLHDYIDIKARFVTDLRPLALSLSQLVCAWEEFAKGDIRYFRDHNTHSTADYRRRGSLHVVESQYSGLRMKLKQLEDLIRTLKDDQANALLDSAVKKRSHTLAEEQAIFVKKQAEEALHAQRESAATAKNMNNTSMCVLPLMLSFTFFSMADSALPFTRTWQRLVLSFVTFAMMTALLVNVVGYVSITTGDMWRKMREWSISDILARPEKRDSEV